MWLDVFTPWGLAFEAARAAEQHRGYCVAQAARVLCWRAVVETWGDGEIDP